VAPSGRGGRWLPLDLNQKQSVRAALGCHAKESDMKRLSTLALAAGLVLAAAPAFAQTDQEGGGMMGPGGGMMGPGGGMMGGGMMGGHGMMGGNLKAAMEGRLAYLKTALEITDAQAAVWKAYEDASRANVQSMQMARETMIKAMQSGSALDRMQARITMMQARLDAMKALQPATEALYKALSPEQQKTADTLLGRGRGMM
jgi:Spy/CpxP family protein refolding chaperone